jgi:hypothetical protein
MPQWDYNQVLYFMSAVSRANSDFHKPIASIFPELKKGITIPYTTSATCNGFIAKKLTEGSNSDNVYLVSS